MDFRSHEDEFLGYLIQRPQLRSTSRDYLKLFQNSYSSYPLLPVYLDDGIDSADLPKNAYR